MKPELIYRQIGRIIRTLRRGADKAQDVLAGQLGISRATLANMETGRQRILVHQLYAIAEALNVELSDLLPPRKIDGAAENLASLPIEGDLSTEQKKQVANLIGSVGASAPRTMERPNDKTKPTNKLARNSGTKTA